MKKVYYFILSGAAIFAVAACNKEAQVEDTPQNNEPIYETLSVKVGTETKVSLETGYTKSAFEENDKIAVWTGAGAFQPCTVDGEGKISVNISGGARSNYAVYYNGATIPTFESSTLKLTLPDTYNYDYVAGDKNPVPMVAKNASGDPADMTFYAVGTLFRVTVKAIPSDATGLVFQFPGKKVNGTFTVTNPGTSTPSVATSAPGIGEDKVTVTFAAGTATEMTLNIPLPTGAYDDVYITPVGGETKVASARHIKAGGYTAARANGRTLTATLVSFSVAANKKVVFAPGNLQYQASSGKWRFAENQWTYIGDNAGNTTAEGSRATQSDWIDLFGWGTSGWNNSGSGYGAYYHPYDSAWGEGSAETAALYGPTGTLDLTETFARGDWGVNNAIGDYPAGTWRTPTGKSGNGDLYYLLFVRDDSANPQKSAYASVNGKYGVILLPDVFIDPQTNAHKTYGPNFIPKYASLRNDYSGDGWKAMEEAGAVFFPMAGYRSGTTISSVGSYGYYWTATAGVKKAAKDDKPEVPAESNASRIIIRSDKYIFSSTQLRSSGLSVRLVRDLN